jgi:hypothetical protein
LSGTTKSGADRRLVSSPRRSAHRPSAAQALLRDIGYLVPEPAPFKAAYGWMAQK